MDSAPGLQSSTSDVENVFLSATVQDFDPSSPEGVKRTQMSDVINVTKVLGGAATSGHCLHIYQRSQDGVVTLWLESSDGTSHEIRHHEKWHLREDISADTVLCFLDRSVLRFAGSMTHSAERELRYLKKSYVKLKRTFKVCRKMIRLDHFYTS